MNVLGIRCSNTDYCFAVLTGSKAAPQLVASGMIALPKGYTRLQCVKWLLQEIEELIKSHNIEKIAMKKSEAMSKGSAYEERVEHEAAVYLAAANCGLRLASKRAGSTIAKGLGLKGRAKYLAQFDTSALPSYRSLPPKVQEAVLAGWSDLL